LGLTLIAMGLTLLLLDLELTKFDFWGVLTESAQLNANVSNSKQTGVSKGLNEK
tara:strand:+ start:28 stop:189 length:162 start_codon:yes stop_codon:yes gene_type:complete